MVCTVRLAGWISASLCADSFGQSVEFSNSLLFERRDTTLTSKKQEEKVEFSSLAFMFSPVYLVFCPLCELVCEIVADFV